MSKILHTNLRHKTCINSCIKKKGSETEFFSK